MARLLFAKDGHPYLKHGYHVLDQFGGIDAAFSTYQLYDGAESLLREAGLRERSSVPRPTFYALLIDGEIYNTHRPVGVAITSVPVDVRAEAERRGAVIDEAQGLKRLFGLDHQQRTRDLYRAIARGYAHPALQNDRLELLQCLLMASWYRLFRAVRASGL
jgi:hypothetical protein